MTPDVNTAMPSPMGDRIPKPRGPVFFGSGIQKLPTLRISDWTLPKKKRGFLTLYDAGLMGSLRLSDWTLPKKDEFDSLWRRLLFGSPRNRQFWGFTWFLGREVVDVFFFWFFGTRQKLNIHIPMMDDMGFLYLCTYTFGENVWKM